MVKFYSNDPFSRHFWKGKRIFGGNFEKSIENFNFGVLGGVSIRMPFFEA